MIPCTSRQFIPGPRRDKQPFILTFTPKDNLESPVDLKNRFTTNLWFTYPKLLPMGWAVGVSMGKCKAHWDSRTVLEKHYISAGHLWQFDEKLPHSHFTPCMVHFEGANENKTLTLLGSGVLSYEKKKKEKCSCSLTVQWPFQMFNSPYSLKSDLLPAIINCRLCQVITQL